MHAPHAPEFRQRAVELARLREKPIAAIAKDLGISKNPSADCSGVAGSTPDHGGEIGTPPRLLSGSPLGRPHSRVCDGGISTIKRHLPADERESRAEFGEGVLEPFGQGCKWSNYLTQFARAIWRTNSASAGPYIRGSAVVSPATTSRWCHHHAK